MCADTTTVNYGWIKPEVSGSASTWGTKQNGVFDEIDAQVFGNQQGITPIGSGMLWFTATPPANYLLCKGQSLATVGIYAGLFAVLGYTYGGSGANFNLPNFNDNFLRGSGTGAVGAVGGAATVTLTAAQIPAHVHPVIDSGHNHAITQTPHIHPDPSHNHSASQDPHNHTYTRDSVGAGSIQAGSFVGNITDVTSTSQPAVHIGASGTGIQAANANVVNNPQVTGITVGNNTGGGGSHNNLPPFITINMIVRYK